jgi:hypothetical protein
MGASPHLGGACGIGGYNRLARLQRTSLDRFGYWGLTLTCAHDEVRLLTHLAVANRLLSDASRQYELFLMEHVVSRQRWGVSSGIPSSVGG